MGKNNYFNFVGQCCRSVLYPINKLNNFFDWLFFNYYFWFAVFKVAERCFHQIHYKIWENYDQINHNNGTAVCITFFYCFFQITEQTQIRAHIWRVKAARRGRIQNRPIVCIDDISEKQYTGVNQLSEQQEVIRTCKGIWQALQYGFGKC